MKRKIIGLLIIIVGLLSLVALLYYLFINGLFPSWLKFWEADNVSPVQNVSEQNGQEKNNINDNNVQPKKVINFNENGDIEEGEVEHVKKEFGKDDLMRLASSFAERFGSYSNQSNFSNVEDLKIYMTDSMKSWSVDYIMEHRGVVTDSENYFGVTTKAIDSLVTEYDEAGGTAKITVTCRRREAKDAMENSGEVYSQDVVILMKKEYDSWKVDNAFWEDRN